ncbi:hypothetical protein NDA01_29865, partial [Trichocoleus desertorum AS-A10]|uniref:hypothetical protein n=1 Tax=Trichocoleus desertorum TaxID=1481672 RepID=UPI00329724ED
NVLEGLQQLMAWSVRSLWLKRSNPVSHPLSCPNLDAFALRSPPDQISENLAPPLLQPLTQLGSNTHSEVDVTATKG